MAIDLDPPLPQTIAPARPADSQTVPSAEVGIGLERRMMSKQERAASLLDGSGMNLALRYWPTWRGVLVLNYHRLGHGPDDVLAKELWSATPDQFDRQMAYLRRNADVIRPDELGDALQTPFGRHVLLTFDDGYRDNYELAFPILESHGLSAIFFIVTSMIDTPRLLHWDEITWMLQRTALPRVPAGLFRPEPLPLDDRDRTGERLTDLANELSCVDGRRFLDALGEDLQTGRAPDEAADGVWMSWDEIRVMQAAGMGIGGHTVTHPMLSRRSAQCVRNELTICGDRLREELGEPMRFFSYPYGGLAAFGRHCQTICDEIGVEYAFSQYGGWQKQGRWEPYDLKRVAVERWMTPAYFHSLVNLPQMSGRPARRVRMSQSSGSLEATIVTDEAAWAALEPEWRELFDAAPQPAPCLRFEWMWNWWQRYGQRYGGDGRLRLITIRDGGQLVALLPLYEAARGGVWRFLSSGEQEHEETCADHLDLLHRSFDEARATAALARFLSDEGCGWRELCLESLKPESPLWNLMRPLGGRAEPLARVGAIDLRFGFEQYLNSLSKSSRKYRRRWLKSAENGSLTFEVAQTREQAVEFFDQMVELHQSRWTAAGKPGCYAAERFTEFHRTMLNELPVPEALLMARLSDGDLPLVVLQAFRAKDLVDIYQIGTIGGDHGRVRSPGMAAYTLLLQWLAEHDVRRARLLRGEGEHKERLAGEWYELANLRAERSRWRRMGRAYVRRLRGRG